MDKSFQNSLFGPTPKSKFGSRKSFLGKNSGGRYSLSTKSNVSTLQVVARSENNIIEIYGLPLPVQVNEALTFTDKNAAVSVSCSSNGWAWVVCGRKLLVWQYKSIASSSNSDSTKTPQRRHIASQCRVLTLPHSDIGHKASLITVFTPEGHQMASCLSVSPTGDLRFWPSIAHDGSTIEESGIMDGQEFEEIVNIGQQGYLLVTTTCHLVSLQIQVVNGRQLISHRIIKPPTGFLGGIGKKFASIIIGLNKDDKESKLIKLSVEPAGPSRWHISVLADKWFQRWSFSGTNEQYQFEDVDILKKIRDTFSQKIWTNREINEIELWLLDMQTQNDEVILLVAATNKSHTPEMYYALISFNINNLNLAIKKFQLLKHKNFYAPETETDSLAMRFIYSSETAYVYNEKMIFLVNMLAVNDENEKIEFQAQSDRIMSASCHNNLPLFFSRLHGLVSVSSSDFDVDFFNVSDVFSPALPGAAGITAGDLEHHISSVFSPNTTNVGNLTMYELDPEEIYSENKDSVNKLKAALIYHLKRNNTKSQSVIKELLASATDSNKKKVDSTLDRTVIKLAQDLAEDTPAADPRWENVQQKYSLGSSSSMQIIQQLREKNSAMNHFIEFLHATKLWEKLYAITDAGIVKPTGQLLSDISEKMVAAISLKCIHSRHNRIIDEAINVVIKDAKCQPYGNLTNQDLFYVQVTRIQSFFSALVKVIDVYVENDSTISQIQNALIDVNSIVLNVLTEVNKFRGAKADLFQFADTDNEKAFEFLPWTSAGGKNGLRDTLLKLIHATQQHVVQTGEPELRQKFYFQLTELIDIVLDGRLQYLNSVSDTGKAAVLKQQYESQRSDLLFNLINGEQYELAAKLAEKYLDFQTLVMICDKTNNQERLNEYIERFKDDNFSQFAISWHMRQNKQRDLFQRFKHNQPALAKFLSDHPSLAWVQLMFNGDLAKAAEVLFKLAENEKELVARKRTMLSLSKLAAIATEDDSPKLIASINHHLTLIEHQEQLPVNLLAAFGYDDNQTKVLEPKELIALYVSPENAEATEVEFRKALELLSYVDEEDVDDVKHKIWCAAILRNSWSDYNADAASDVIQDMLFFKLIDLCHFLDGQLDFLPPKEHFLTAAPELGSLAVEQSFQFLLKLGYEHISETYGGKK